MQIGKYWNYQDLLLKTGFKENSFKEEINFKGKYRKKNNYDMVMNKTLELSFLRQFSQQSQYYFLNMYLKNLNPYIIKNKIAKRNFILANIMEIEFQKTSKFSSLSDWKTQRVIKSSLSK